MSRVLLQKTDLHGLAARGAIVRERLAAAELDRLAPLVTDGAALIACELELRLDGGGNTIVNGTVRAGLSLPCQRCLEPAPCKIDTKIEAALACDDEALDALAHEYETVLSADAARLADLVEEELLLALPLVAMHGSIDECGPLAAKLTGGDDDGSEQRTTNKPFAVLKALRSD